MTPTIDDFLKRWRAGVPQAVVKPFPWPTDLAALYERARRRSADTGSIRPSSRSPAPLHLFLLESRGGPADITRYSILAAGRRELELPARAPEGPDDEAVHRLCAQLSLLPGPTALLPHAPRWPFFGGWIGYLSYDLGRGLERLPVRLPPDDLPPARFIETPAALVCDQIRREAALVACLEPGPDAPATWRSTLEALDELEALIAPASSGWTLESNVVPASSGSTLEWGVAPASSGPALESGAAGVEASPSFRLLEPLTSPYSPKEYQQAVARARAYVHAGDLFQVNISQRFSALAEGDPFGLYQRLRTVSPAPFAGYLDFGDLQILSSSPERYLLLDGERLETRPIKGTFRRGRDEAEDRRLADALKADPKERAEHVMIVDLERNDLGRLAAPDSVRVADLLRVERYPQVLHLVSTVEARLARPPSLWDLVAATFPGGSITGAPKVRALEVIEELERSRRGVYTGAVGYVSRCGRIDLNLAIRTLVVRNGRLEMQVGGGIVADSDPVREYEETLLKALGMRRALGLE